MYVPVLVRVLPFAVISLIVYCAVLAKLALVAVVTVMLKVTELPLRIGIDVASVPGLTPVYMAATFESIYAELIVTVAEPVF